MVIIWFISDESIENWWSCHRKLNYALFNLDASVVVNKVLEADDVNFGYDAMEGEYVNMIEQGIIDPTKVITNQCWKY